MYMCRNCQKHIDGCISFDGGKCRMFKLDESTLKKPSDNQQTSFPLGETQDGKKVEDE